MPPFLITLLAAATLGFLHALEVDHMVAVTAFVSSRPALRSAAAFGARWGLGHSVAVLAAGGILLLTGLRWPEHYDSWGEAAVGLMLIGVGIWAIVAARRLHLHAAGAHGDHLHLHAHGRDARGHEHRHDARAPAERPHHHGHGITLVGLLHGLAGTSAVVALVPVTLIESRSEGLAYLVAFGLGTTVAMTLFAVIAAGAMRAAAERSIQWGRRLSTLVGLGGIAVGVYWIWNAASLITGSGTPS
jgi:ABC-type nickel/cobalt efflux system permease component RcnA